MNDEEQTDNERDDPQSTGGPAITATTVDEIPVPHGTADFGSETPPQPPVVDPDHPGWGPGTGIAVWLLSVGSTILVPLLGLLVWLLISIARGTAPVTGQDAAAWVTTPGSLMVQVWSNLPAHVLTFGVCWFVVTKGWNRPFLASLGWGRGARPALFWVALSVLIIVGLFMASIVLQMVLPEAKESAFDTLLRSTFGVRLALAFVAVVSAPLVEELVYRGVLYGGLRSKLGTVATVIFVTLLFSSVHAAQYWGKWASMATLTLLSLALTTMRAASGSVLPSVILHQIFNSIQSVAILVQGESGQSQSQ